MGCRESWLQSSYVYVGRELASNLGIHDTLVERYFLLRTGIVMRRTTGHTEDDRKTPERAIKSHFRLQTQPRDMS